MKPEILFLTHRVPYPPDRGDKIRSWNVLRHIAQIAPVHVCALWDDARDLQHRAVLEGVAASVSLARANPSRAFAVARALVGGGSASVAACASAELQARVDNLLATRPIATIYAFSGQMAQFVPKDCEARFVMDFVDVDSAKFAAMGTLAAREEARRLLAWEKMTAARADISLLVSEAEKAAFGDIICANRVETLENGIDLAFFNSDADFDAVKMGRPSIVFTGQMDYRPNIDAVSQFAFETLPLVRRALGDAHFHIVGRAPTSEVIALDTLPGVTVTGEVPDTRGWLAAADVVVAPLLLARGVQNKVLEAMAMARPVVASAAAAEGLDAVTGEHFLVADGPVAQSRAIISMLQDRAQAARIGEAARARVEARYSWDARLAGLARILGFEQPATVSAVPARQR